MEGGAASRLDATRRRRRSFRQSRDGAPQNSGGGQMAKVDRDLPGVMTLTSDMQMRRRQRRIIGYYLAIMG